MVCVCVCVCVGGWVCVGVIPCAGNIAGALADSLKRLGLSYVDLYLIHAPFFDAPTKLVGVHATVVQLHVSMMHVSCDAIAYAGGMACDGVIGGWWVDACDRRLELSHHRLGRLHQGRTHQACCESRYVRTCMRHRTLWDADIHVTLDGCELM